MADSQNRTRYIRAASSPSLLFRSMFSRQSPDRQSNLIASLRCPLNLSKWNALTPANRQSAYSGRPRPPTTLPVKLTPASQQSNGSNDPLRQIHGRVICSTLLNDIISYMNCVTVDGAMPSRCIVPSRFFCTMEYHSHLSRPSPRPTALAHVDQRVRTASGGPKIAQGGERNHAHGLADQANEACTTPECGAQWPTNPLDCPLGVNSTGGSYTPDDDFLIDRASSPGPHAPEELLRGSRMR